MFQTARLPSMAKKQRIFYQSVNDAFQLTASNLEEGEAQRSEQSNRSSSLSTEANEDEIRTYGTRGWHLRQEIALWFTPGSILWTQCPLFPESTECNECMKWLKLTGQDMSKAHERLYPHLKHISSGIRSSVAHGARAMKRQGEDSSQLPDVRKLKYLRCSIDLRTGSAALPFLDVGASTQTHVLESVATWWYGILYESRRGSSQAVTNISRHHDDAFALR